MQICRQMSLMASDSHVLLFLTSAVETGLSNRLRL